ncbi:YdgA family protein [Pseudomonas sp. CDFA 602]|uniref:YdgA family protein n=1 Tax=Pseudomonas californiensis TaxID=2829823 RepID=UPI001E3CB521|nr:YdgA family protein [Pseudomonas californiensis]MCD5997277.1 YdgA family protein [Pseudomonas californiensis]MCD6002878.1 YdgA family protein [Pseudomonas californiensis]
MNKSAGIAIGVIVVAGALVTGGAWYTGTRLEGALNESIAKANQELAKSFKGTDTSVTLKMVSLDKHFFSSTAHYSVDIQKLTDSTQGGQFLFVDQIEHGPIPLSRLKTLNLLPVMALSNFQMEKSPSSEKWFAMSKDVSPITGKASIGYDKATKGWLKMAPLEMNDTDGTFKFSGLLVNAESSADADKFSLDGNMDNLQLNVTSPDGPVSIDVKNMTFDTGGTKGKSGFYLGHTNMKIQNAGFQAVGKPQVLIKDFTNTNLAQEDAGNLAAQINYDVGMIAYGGKDVGSAHLGFKIANFDAVATQALYQLYQNTIMPQQQAAILAEQPFKLELTPAEQEVMNTQLKKLLAGKPHIELEKLSLKTANGESHVRVAVDLADPGSLDQPADALAMKALGEINAKVVVSKPMIRDIATQQALREGQTDLKVIAEQATAASDMASAMAEMMQLAKVDGDNIVSDLHYANQMVDFNGQKMTVQQFMANVMGKVGVLGNQ